MIWSGRDSSFETCVRGQGLLSPGTCAWKEVLSMIKAVSGFRTTVSMRVGW